MRGCIELACKRLGDYFERQRDDFLRLLAYEAELPHLHAYQEHARQASNWPAVARSRWLEAYPPYHRGQYQQAHYIVRDALDLFVRWQVRDQTLEANLRGDLGSTYSALGEYQEALKLAKDVLAIRREVLGEKHRDTATAMGNLASTYSALGEYQEALKLEKDVLAIRREVLGERHPDTAIAMGNLGSTYSALGEYQEALKLAKDVLAIRREVLGEKHPDTTGARRSVALCFLKMGRGMDALRTVQEGLRELPRDSRAAKDLMDLKTRLLDTRGRPLQPGFRQPSGRGSKKRRR